MIEINDLQKSYGSKKAIDIARYSIADGDMLGLVGNNGAGKTTLFRLILDLVRADQGTVAIAGTDVTRTLEGHHRRLYRRRLPHRLPHARRILLLHRPHVRAHEGAGGRTPPAV